MSDKLTDAKAEFIFDQANRRAKLLAIILKSRPGYWSLWPATQGITAVLVAAMLVLMLAQITLREADTISSILPLAALSIIAIASDVAILNRRMDALVKLLREDGVLQGTPPTIKLLEKQ